MSCALIAGLKVAEISRSIPYGRGKYQPKMIGLCDWTLETRVIIVYDSFFRKPISIVHCLSFL